MIAADGTRADPLAVEVNVMPRIQARLGQLLAQTLVDEDFKQALDAKAREIIAQQSGVIAEKDQRIAELEAMLPKNDGAAQ